MANNMHSHDTLYTDAVSAAIAHGTVSIAHLQRKLGIGYNRAANLVNDMERNRVVSAPDHKGHRTILVAEQYSP